MIDGDLAFKESTAGAVACHRLAERRLDERNRLPRTIVVEASIGRLRPDDRILVALRYDRDLRINQTVDGPVIDPHQVALLTDRQQRHSPLDELTPREREILALMAEGRSNQAIAGHLVLELKTIEGHVRAIFSKLGLEPSHHDHRRVLAVLAYLRM